MTGLSVLWLTVSLAASDIFCPVTAVEFEKIFTVAAFTLYYVRAPKYK